MIEKGEFGFWDCWEHGFHTCLRQRAYWHQFLDILRSFFEK